MASRRENVDKPLVLVVDDVEDNRAMYAEYFAYKGFRVAQATNGTEAIDRARALRPAVVIMDLSMPGIDGWEATRVIKSDEALQETCVIAVSGHGDLELKERASESGVDAFVLKPCAPADLFEVVQARLRRE